MSSHQNTSLIYKLPIEALYYIFECMTEKDQLNFALSRWCFYKVFRTYHIGYSSPKWFPINITRHVMEGSGDVLFSRELEPINNLTRNIPNAPPAANYHDGVLLNGKLYLTIFEKESPICWILDFDIIPLNWRRVNVTFVEFDLDDDEVDELESSNITEYKKQSDVNVRTYKPEMNRQKSIYQPLRSTTAAAISPMIYLFGGECLTTGEPSGTLYVLDPIRMILKEIMGQGGDLPSARKMHSLNAIGSQCLVLFGGRCLMNDSDYPREYDTKEFHVYDISTKIWTMYRDPHDHVPYARYLHSTTVLEYSLYIYGGRQITSSTPESRIHDDDDLWCFTFNSSQQQEDSADEEQNTPESSTSSRGSNKSGISRISSSFQQEKWQKLFSPRNFTSPAFSSGIGGEWHTTTGNNVGRRCGAAMFNVGKRIAVLGGYERDNWKWNFSGNEKGKAPLYSTSEREESGRNNDEKSDSKPWELCKLYLPDRKRWDQVKIANFPEMECIAISLDHTKDVFIMGRKKGDTEEHGITMGWIKETSNI